MRYNYIMDVFFLFTEIIFQHDMFTLHFLICHEVIISHCDDMQELFLLLSI